MLFERIVSEGISHISYLIGSQGKAAVIDPRRDCDIYIDIARSNDLIITHIFETHRNEDYLIGSLELAGRCGAEIYHGADMPFSYGKPVSQVVTYPTTEYGVTKILPMSRHDQQCSQSWPVSLSCFFSDQ